MHCIFFLIMGKYIPVQFDGIELNATKSYASVHVPTNTSRIQFNFPKR